MPYSPVYASCFFQAFSDHFIVAGFKSHYPHKGSFSLCYESIGLLTRSKGVFKILGIDDCHFEKLHFYHLIDIITHIVIYSKLNYCELHFTYNVIYIIIKNRAMPYSCGNPKQRVPALSFIFIRLLPSGAMNRRKSRLFPLE